MNYCDYDRDKAERLAHSLRDSVSQAKNNAREAIEKYRQFVQSTVDRVNIYIGELDKQISKCYENMQNPDIDAHAYHCYKAQRDALSENKWYAQKILESINNPWANNLDEVDRILNKLTADIDNLIAVIRTEQCIMNDAASLGMSGQADRKTIRRISR